MAVAAPELSRSVVAAKRWVRLNRFGPSSGFDGSLLMESQLPLSMEPGVDR